MTLLTATLYEIETGRIVGALTGTIDMLAVQPIPDGQAVLFGAADAATQMVVDGELVPRPVMPVTVDKSTILADGADEAVVSGVEEGTAFLFGSEEHVANGEDIRVSADTPGSYVLAFRGFPHQSWSVEIAAVEAVPDEA